jgi:hypothetical protein
MERSAIRERSIRLRWPRISLRSIRATIAARKKVNQKLGQWPTWQIIPKENRSFTNN